MSNKFIYNERFDDIIRTEKYFTATLLPLLLFHNNMEGLRKFCALLDGVQPEQSQYKYNDFEDYQILSEFHIARDLQHAGLIDSISFNKDEHRDAPDLVIIAVKEIIAIEAKFFGRFNLKSLSNQISSQKKQIEKLLPYLNAKNHRHVAVIPEKMDGLLDVNAIFTWKEMADLSASVMGVDAYVTKRLQRAVERYRSNLSIRSGPNFDGIGEYNEIKERCERGEEIAIGFAGGLSRLKGERLGKLQERMWKWRRPSNTGRTVGRNWIDAKAWLQAISRLPA